MLKQAGYTTRSAASPAEALKQLDDPAVELVIQDMNFSRATTGEEGLELLQQIKQRRSELPVILITAWGSIGLAVRGVKAGAADFITKPWNNQQLLQAVATTLGLAASARKTAGRTESLTRDELDSRYDFHSVIGRDPRFLKILEVVGRVSSTDASVLITGESGTGKEVIAEAIHRNSRRHDRPFVKVNLGGISSTLFESEMFGHVRGAFTDAYQDRKGRFEVADTGTIFLDEIGDLDPSSQVKMLRVLQDRRYEVLGTSKTRSVDVRVISATNRDLAELVSRGEFREDLLYRLNLIAVHIPPLRERTGDIPLLAEHFLRGIAQVYRRDRLTLSPAAANWLRGLNWPGNVRQLKQLIERTVLVTDKDVLDVEDFSLPAQMESDGRLTDSKTDLPAAGSMTMDEIEKAMIVKCLESYEGNISRVAEALGMSRAALYRRFEKYGLKP